MKFNFRKIVSVLTSTVMLSSTLAFAAAANFPAPFVKGGAGDVAVVYGGAAGAAGGLDYTAVLDINSKLSSSITSTGATTTVIDGDSVMLSKETNKFNLGNAMNSFYATLDDDQLSKVLMQDVYENDAGDEYDYDQSITLGANTLGFQQDDDFNDETPFIGFDLTSGDQVLNYSLDFNDDAEGGSADGNNEYPEFTGTYLKMLGKEYYISDAESSSNGFQLTLLDSANEIVVSKGERQTVTVGGKSYDIELTFVHSTNGVKLTVNGQDTGLLDEGQTKKLSDGTYVSILENLAGEDSDADSAKISIGSGKMVLENGQEVEMNGETLSDIDQFQDHELKAYFVNSSTDLSSITLQWKLKDDAWLSSGSELVLPGFESIKLSMGDFVTEANEVTTLKNSGTDRLVLETELSDGNVSLPVLFFNSTGILAVGKDTDKVLKTSASNTFTVDEDIQKYFVATRYNGDDAESYILQIDSIKTASSSNDKNTTKISSIAQGSSVSQDIDVGETEEIGDISIKLNSADEASGVANFTISGTGTVTANKLVTKEGLLIKLPIAAAVASTDTSEQYVNVPGVTTGINATYPVDTSFVMNFTEEDKDGDIGDGSHFTATLGLNGDSDTAVTAVSVTDYETADSTDDFIGYVSSDLATSTLYKTGSDQDTLDITYHGEEAYAQVYVSEADATVSSGGSSGSLAVSDSEVGSVQGKNLIVVGGSCVNTVAAKLLGSTTPVCGADWEAKTGAGAGSFLIKTFASPYASGKIATLVAGYNAGDTGNGAKYLTTQTLDVEAVGTTLKGTSETQATLVTS